MTQGSETLKTETTSSIGRRGLIHGAAWSVPAVALVGATPAMAQSGLKVTVTAITAVRGSGVYGNNVDFTLSISNPNGAAVTVNSISFSSNTGWASYPTNYSTPDTVNPGPNVGVTSFRAVEWNFSADFPLLTFTLVDSRGTAFNVTVTINAGSTNTNPQSFTLS